MAEIEEEEQLIRESQGNSLSASSPLGRVMTPLLDSRVKHLETAISRVDSVSQKSSGALLDDSLRFIRSCARGCVEREEPMDQILVPMIESSLRHKSSKHCKHALVLLKWLLQDELLFEALLSDLAKIIATKEDNYIILGWCFLVREFVDHELNADQNSDVIGGKQVKRRGCLKILSPSISQLMSTICRGSIVQNGFELPTRLSVAAADCMLALTVALAHETSVSTVPSSRSDASYRNANKHLVSSVSEPTDSGRMEVHTHSCNLHLLGDVGAEILLWNHLDDLVTIVRKLQAWNRKSRHLHAMACNVVLKWLLDIKDHYYSLKDEAGGKVFKEGLSLLSSCWKHYGILLHLDNPKISQLHKQMLDQYMSAIQFSAQDEISEHAGRSGGLETKKFFLNCLCLLLGHLDIKQLEIVIAEYGQQIAFLLIPQLHCPDEDVVELAVSILKAFIFKANLSFTGTTPYSCFEMEELLPLLLNLLDERDNISRAVASLVAEYCIINPNGQCLSEIFKRLDVGNQCQRMNAIDVLSELINLSSDSGKALPPSLQEILAQHLLKRLEVEDSTVLARVSYLLPRIDAVFVLPKLVHYIYCLEERVQSSASSVLVAVLKYHSKNVDVVLLLIDCLRDLSQQSDLPKPKGKTVSMSHVSLQSASKVDPDRIFNLIPKWTDKDDDWNALIESLMDKMFSEPSNAIIVRFLSHISEKLADAKVLVLSRVVLHMQSQEELDERSFAKCGVKASKIGNPNELKDALFNRLCPMLVLRMLPMRIFSDINCHLMYGHLNMDSLKDRRSFDLDSHVCVASLLFNRMFNLLEFEDIRKLAAELCGRLLPQVLFPIILSPLQNATESKDVLKLKACLFTVCTSLVVWGKDAVSHPAKLKMQEILEKILLWPSLDNSEVSKVQHGCIDCLALMICTELQSLQRQRDPSERYAATKSSVLNYVIKQLTCGLEVPNLSHMEGQSDDRLTATDEAQTESTKPIPFRLCMANILISSCQKISDSGKRLFAQAALPHLVQFVEITTNSEIRAACIQVLFSSVYHLKCAVLPYSSQLLKLSIKALKHGSVKEKIAGVKLMASLMGSEDEFVESISEGLFEAKSVLGSISCTTASAELKQLCDKLLVCMSPSFKGLSGVL